MYTTVWHTQYDSRRGLMYLVIPCEIIHVLQKQQCIFKIKKKSVQQNAHYIKNTMIYLMPGNINNLSIVSFTSLTRYKLKIKIVTTQKIIVEKKKKKKLKKYF